MFKIYVRRAGAKHSELYLTTEDPQLVECHVYILDTDPSIDEMCVVEERQLYARNKSQGCHSYTLPAQHYTIPTGIRSLRR